MTLRHKCHVRRVGSNQDLQVRRLTARVCHIMCAHRSTTACAIVVVWYLWKRRQFNKYKRQYIVSLVEDRDYKVVGKVPNPPLECTFPRRHCA